MSARVLIRVDQYGLASAASLGLADEADDALVFQRRIGRTDVSALVGQLHHLVLIDQLLAIHTSAHSCLSVFNAHSCGTQTRTSVLTREPSYRKHEQIDLGTSPASEAQPAFFKGPQTLRRYILLTSTLWYTVYPCS